MTSTTYTVQGMTCSSCARKVTNAVSPIMGVDGTEVDIAAGTLTVTGTADPGAVRAAIGEAGYKTT
ncbi:heavy-metal-associated domain-containing protein [Luteipulveratus halotolerans]|uniref:HMA domain-containing protein n=1 Tax=Luteipulveratus halotolerans TaxID=1631356 RepID=A0A0L6CJ08_9MICO|nr:heavy metal-associated domain-containing protein [Luteipulveratus halotolerans]KNX37786.1 hypothetical protein VV01_12515 [Luteipulveratus halotolerans]